MLIDPGRWVCQPPSRSFTLWACLKRGHPNSSLVDHYVLPKSLFCGYPSCLGQSHWHQNSGKMIRHTITALYRYSSPCKLIWNLAALPNSIQLDAMIFRNKHMCQTLVDINGRSHILLIHIDSQLIWTSNVNMLKLRWLKRKTLKIHGSKFLQQSGH